MILNHSEATFYRFLVNAREGQWAFAGKMVGVMTLDGATLKPVKATETFLYNNQATTKAIELLTDGVTIDTAYNITVPAIAYGVGGLTKKGEGTLTLSAANLYTGATKVEAGKLVLTGSVAGPLEVGTNGTLVVTMKDGVPVQSRAASIAFADGAKISLDVTGLDLTGGREFPFLLLPADGKVTGTPTVVMTGVDGKRWKVLSRQTADGVLCSIAPATGFTILIQ